MPQGLDSNSQGTDGAKVVTGEGRLCSQGTTGAMGMCSPVGALGGGGRVLLPSDSMGS